MLTAVALIAATLLLFFAYHNHYNPVVKEVSLFLAGAGLLAAGLACALIWVWTLLGEFKQAAEELRERREQLSRVVDGSTDGFWDWHVPSGVTHHNARWAEMLGYKLDEIDETHDQWIRLVHPEDGKEANRLMHEYWAGRIPSYEMEMRLRHKSGHWHWVLSRGKVATWVAAAQPEWMTGTNVDIHAQRRARQLLALQYAAAEFLNRNEPLEKSGEKILQATCECLECSAGALWLAAPDDSFLQNVCEWHRPGDELAEIMEGRRTRRIPRGSGLPGRAWESGVLEWTPHLQNEPHFPYSAFTGKSTLDSGFASPVRSGQKIIGAFEFFGNAMPQPDDALLAALSKIAGQIALFLQHTQAEATLREREAMLRSLGDNLPEGAIYQVMLDAPTGRRSVNYISGGIETLTGISGTQIQANPELFYKFEPEDILPFRKASDESARTLNVFDSEARYRLARNGVKWLHYRSAPRRLPNGNTIWDGIVTDVTERKRSEERVKRYEFIVNSIADLICLVNGEFIFEAINDAWCNALQRKRADMIGQSAGDILGASFFEEQLKPHVQRCFEGKPEFYQVWMDLGVYGRRHCSIAIYPYWGEPGRVTHAIIVTRDTTAENAAESQLIRAIQAAEEANRAKSVFLANMSHEIRTPMNAIIGMGYLLKQTSMNEKQNDYASKIDSAARSLLRIINDILDFSKVEAGKVEIETEEFNLDEVLSNLVQLTTTQAQQKGLDFKVHVAPGTPQNLLGDPLRLGQVLLNLTSNAVKFTEKGGIAITVENNLRDNRFVVLRFSVSDTGIGLSDQQLKRIFEPFCQADVTTTRRYGGTGLGLAISKRYVEMMGGSIEVQSKLGEGSTFSFTAQFAHPTKNSRRVHAIRLLVSGRRALIVDHDESSRTTMTTILKQLAFVVTAVDTAESAIKEIKEFRENSAQNFDLVLYDHSLPGIDWAASARAIFNSFGATHPAMVLLASPDAGEVDAESAAAAGFDKHLVKPVTRSALYDAIMNAFAKSAQRNALVRSEELQAPAADKILKGKRILLVEDNEINQQVAEEILLLAGCVVRIASNGVEALSILLNDSPEIKFDAVLMDLQMPDMDGYKVTRCIRADKTFAKLPIVAMTADAVSGVREACLEAGMNDYLTKPIKFDELYNTLARRIRETLGESSVETLTPLPAEPAGMLVNNTAEPAMKPWMPKTIAMEHPRPASRRAPNVELHVDSGIARVGGNRILYFRLLQHFSAKYGQMANDVDSMLERGEKENALRFLHTIKGVAANLGVDTLSQGAARWEAALKADSPTAQNEARTQFRQIARESLDKIADTLAMTKSDLPAVAADPTASGGGAVPPREPAREPLRQAALEPARISRATLDHLAALLGNSDIDAGKLAQTMAGEIQNAAEAAEFRRIIELILQLKFPEAAQALVEFRARRGM